MSDLPTMRWGGPAIETYGQQNQGGASTNANIMSSEVNVDFDQAFLDLMTSPGYVHMEPSPVSPSVPTPMDNFKLKQKEALEEFLKKQQIEEDLFLLEKQMEEEEKRKQQEEEEKERVKEEKKSDVSDPVCDLLKNILNELSYLRSLYETSLQAPKKKRPSRAKKAANSSPTTSTATSATTTSAAATRTSSMSESKRLPVQPLQPPLPLPPMKINALTARYGLGRGKGLRQLKLINV